MNKVFSILIGGSCLLLFALSAVRIQATPAAGPDEGADEVLQQEPAAPSGQTYIGTTKCAACHFKQFVEWKKDSHSKAFDQLPAKYRSDAECLKCHTTGFGKDTGFKTAADKHLAGITCESCHGPGSTHADVCASLPKGGQLTPEQDKAARDSIWMMLPKNVCVTCHDTKSHKTHPPFDK